MEVILGGIFLIYYKVNTILINQVLKLLFHEAYNDMDFLDTYLMKLFDCPFNQWFSIDFHKGFWPLGVDWNHSHTESCCQDDCIFRRTLLELISGF